MERQKKLNVHTLNILYVTSNPFLCAANTNTCFSDIGVSEEIAIYEQVFLKSEKNINLKILCGCNFDQFKADQLSNEWNIIHLSMHGTQDSHFVFEEHGRPQLIPVTGNLNAITNITLFQQLQSYSLKVKMIEIFYIYYQPATQ